MEKTLTSLLPAMAGANMLYGLGMLESGITISHSQLLIDNEMAKFVRRSLQGIPVNESTEAVDVINKVGPRGQFMTQKHTRLHMRENLAPNLSNRRTRDNWVAEGSLDINQKAQIKSREIIADYKPEPLSDKIKGELEDLMRRAEAKKE
jgi:trimethylamine--corrinoid protein Co-methyltransferase